MVKGTSYTEQGATATGDTSGDVTGSIVTAGSVDINTLGTFLHTRQQMHYTILYCTVLYCSTLYCYILYCTILYHTITHYEGLLPSCGPAWAVTRSTSQGCCGILSLSLSLLLLLLSSLSLLSSLLSLVVVVYFVC